MRDLGDTKIAPYRDLYVYSMPLARLVSPRRHAEMQEEIGGPRAEMREGIGKLSDHMTRVETLLETHLVPASDARDPAGP